jgi:hypothetical protein
MKLFYFFPLVLILSLGACSKVKESSGVTRKTIDEFKVVENPPLVIPPDFNLLPPNQLEAKNIENVDRDLASEILFGLDEDKVTIQRELTTMNQILLQANASDASSFIRDEIDKEFAQEVKTDEIFQVDWEDEFEVLDAVKESERIRNKNFEGESLADGEVPTKIKKIKKKKKKRFFFF